MTPTKLFIASLAMCVGIFVLHFAKRHEMPVEGMRIEVDQQMADGPRRVAAVQIRGHMPQPVAPKHQAALRRAAEQCVVHNSLRQPPNVTVSTMA